MVTSSTCSHHRHHYSVQVSARLLYSGNNRAEALAEARYWPGAWISAEHPGSRWCATESRTAAHEAGVPAWDDPTEASGG